MKLTTDFVPFKHGVDTRIFDIQANLEGTVVDITEGAPECLEYHVNLENGFRTKCLPSQMKVLINPEYILPESHQHWLELRSKDITSTEISTLFGLSPYQTQFELWHKKKNGDTSYVEQTDRMKWGTRLESAIANGIAEDKKWKIRHIKEYIRIPQYKIGSSFDFFIDDDGILEIKNVDSIVFKDQWIADESGNYEAPPHIEAQVQYQLLVSQKKYAYIGALVGGNNLVLIYREPDDKIQSAMLKKVKEFWRSVDMNDEPKPNFERDAEFIKWLYRHAEPDKELDATPQIDVLVSEYNSISKQIKDMESKLESIKAELLIMIGDAEKCKGQSYTITAGIVSEAEVSYTRKAYRSFRIHNKKGNKDDKENR